MLHFNPENENDFFNAVFQGNLGAVNEFISEQGIDILLTKTHTSSMTPVQLAAYCGHNQLINFFHSKMPELFNDDQDKASMVHCAAEGGQNDTIDYLKSIHNIHPNAMDQMGANSLHYAARGGKIETITHLSKNYNLNIKGCTNIGANALHYAAMGGQEETIALLAAAPYKLNPKKKFSLGFSILHCAAQEGHQSAFDNLSRQYNIDIHDTTSNGLAPLHSAVKYGLLDMIDHIIITHKFSPFERYQQVDPCRIAEQFGHLEIQKIFDCARALYFAVKQDQFETLHSIFQLTNIEHIKRILTWPMFEGGLTAFEYLCHHNQLSLATLVAMNVRSILQATEITLLQKSDSAAFFHIAARCGEITGMQQAVVDLDVFNSILNHSALANNPFRMIDQQIIYNGLIGGSYSADINQQLDLKHVRLGAPQTKAEIRATNELIFLYARALGDHSVSARYAEILTQCGGGLSAIFEVGLSPEKLCIKTFEISQKRAQQVENYRAQIVKLEATLNRLLLHNPQVSDQLWDPHVSLQHQYSKEVASSSMIALVENDSLDKLARTERQQGMPIKRSRSLGS